MADSAGCLTFASVDLLHSEFGLEVCGIKTVFEAARIQILPAADFFPNGNTPTPMNVPTGRAEDFMVTIQRDPTNHTDTY